MGRSQSIRAKVKRGPTLAAAEAAFWVLVVLACAVGGSRAIVGAPVLAAMLAPSGLMAAQASDDPAPGTAMLPIHLPHQASPYAPVVLTPVASHGFPDWL